ncbi:hypothetical protein QTP88_025753 [Uroleucon formosanum]
MPIIGRRKARQPRNGRRRENLVRPIGVVRQPLGRRKTERGSRLWLKVNILNHIHVACVGRRIQITGNGGVDNCSHGRRLSYRRVVEVVRRRAGNGRSEVCRGRESKPINSYYVRHRNNNFALSTKGETRHEITISVITILFINDRVAGNDRRGFGRVGSRRMTSPSGRCRRASSAVSPWSCFQSHLMSNVNVDCDSTAMTVARNTFLMIMIILRCGTNALSVQHYCRRLNKS